MQYSFIHYLKKKKLGTTIIVAQERNERRSAYFDMQTYRVHYPQNGKGRMRVLKKPKLGNYPVAMIPGQFVDGFKVVKIEN